jgi:TIR domain
VSLRTTIFLAHAERDREFASQLAVFLEFGCDATCYLDEGAMPDGGDLMAKARDGLAADVLALLLSEASWPVRLPRQQWEPVLFEQAREADTELASIALGECPFPELLRRRNFFDASDGHRAAMRMFKRWIWLRKRAPGMAPDRLISRDLEPLYAAIADEAAVMRVNGEMASRFAREAAHEFEAVIWIPAHQRSLAEVSGEIGDQLGLVLEGTAEQNCERVREFLFERRCLLVLDAPADQHANAVIPGGRTSVLITEEPVSLAELPESFERARTLITARRYAEAYELLYRLLDAEITPEACARELTWICDHWGRIEEANVLRFYYGPEPSAQLMLF